MNIPYRTETKAVRRIAILLLCLLLVQTLALGAGQAQEQEQGTETREVALTVTQHRADVWLESPLALVNHTSWLYNPGEETVLATLLHPLEKGVTPLELLVWLEDQRFTLNETSTPLDPAEIPVDGTTAYHCVLDPQQTGNYLRMLVEDHQDPVFLSLGGGRLLVCQFPVAGESFAEVKVHCQGLVDEEGGMKRFSLPLAGGLFLEEGAGLAEDGDVEGKLWLTLSSPYSLEGIYSPSHHIALTKAGFHKAFVEWEGRPYPGEEFLLYYKELSGNFGAGFLDYRLPGKTLYSLGEDGYFMFLFSPNTEEFAEQHIEKDIVFVLDTSGSMRGEKMDQAKEALQDILGVLSPGDRFTLVGFSNVITSFDTGLRNHSEDNVSEAQDWVGKLKSDGGTDINGALLEALDILGKNTTEERPRELVFLTDGLPSAGVTNLEDILENVETGNGEGPQATIHVLGVGYDVNTALLDQLSGDAGGATLYIAPGDDIDETLTRFYETIAYPVLTNVSMYVEGLQLLDQVPGTLPALYKGGELSVLGMYRLPENASEEVTVYVNGSTSSDPVNYVHSFEREGPGKHSYLPRIYATRAVGQLLQDIRQQGETPELVDAVKYYGWRYGIETPYTSLSVQGDPVFDAEGFRELTGQGAVESSQIIHHYSQSKVAGLGLAGNARLVSDRSFLELEGVFVETPLLPEQKVIELGDMAMEEWLAENIEIDRLLKFGSPEYFELAEKEGTRDILALGSELVFREGEETVGVTSGNLILYLGQLKAMSVGEEFTVSWTTSEPASTVLYYRSTVPDDDLGWEVEKNDTLTTEHWVSLTLPYGEYEFFVRSTDELGNTAVKDNNGEYYLYPHRSPEDPGGLYLGPRVDVDRVQITRVTTNVGNTVMIGNEFEVRCWINVPATCRLLVDGSTWMEIFCTGPFCSFVIRIDDAVSGPGERGSTRTITIRAEADLPNATSYQDQVDSFEFEIYVVEYSPCVVSSFESGTVLVFLAAVGCFTTVAGAQVRKRKRRGSA